MPLDPMIANPATIKLDDPLEGYTNYLRAAQYQNEANKARREENVRNALSEAYRLNTDDKGVTNFGGVRAHLAKNGLGEAITTSLEDEGKRAKIAAETDKYRADADSSRAEATKRGVEAFKAAFDNSKSLLDGINPDPKIGAAQYAEYINGQFNDPVIGPMLSQRGMTRESALAQLNAAVQSGQFPDFLMRNRVGLETATKQHYEQMDLGGHKVVQAMPEHSLGTPAARTVSDQRITADPNAGARAPKVSVNVTNIAAKGDSAYTETWNKELAQDDIALKRAADKAPDLAQRSDRIRAVLKTGKVITGFGAPARIQFAKALGLAGMSDKETIANTEVLISDLAKNTLDAIKSSQLGTGNGFSNADREFLNSAVGGKIEFDQDSLTRLSDLSRRAAEQSAMKWQTRYDEIRNTGIQGRAYPPGSPKVPPSPPQSGDGMSPAARALLKKHGH